MGNIFRRKTFQANKVRTSLKCQSYFRGMQHVKSNSSLCVRSGSYTAFQTVRATQPHVLFTCYHKSYVKGQKIFKVCYKVYSPKSTPLRYEASSAR